MSIPLSDLFAESPKRAEEEFKLQKAVCQYLRWALPSTAFFFSIPNGGLRHTRVAQKLAATGCVAGVPDLQVVFKGRALFLELKVPKGAISMVQRQVHNRLAQAEADVRVCRSIDDVEAALKAWGVPLQARAVA